MSAKTILIVDDSFSLRQTISIALKIAGYEVVEAIDGRDALNKLDGRKYNLIISDVNMPNLDGLSFVREAKQNPHYKFTPVLMLTTESGDSRKQEGKAIGVRAWVHKPFLPPVLLDAVAKLVSP
ncbi:response regulator [Herbaspirillum sp. RV1423]|uniref:response regulator n=1 Tax=Herbaspirillum sp. RV1423 TaxID=1443993 RepID=UPI0004B2CD53|nr:response regulator [Herbaspirillum sp. RV1423]